MARPVKSRLPVPLVASLLVSRVFVATSVYSASGFPVSTLRDRVKVIGGNLSPSARPLKVLKTVILPFCSEFLKVFVMRNEAPMPEVWMVGPE